MSHGANDPTIIKGDAVSIGFDTRAFTERRGRHDDKLKK